MSPDRGCFFFQAEDGIRDGHVTGVQTCALPIYERQKEEDEEGLHGDEGEPLEDLLPLEPGQGRASRRRHQSGTFFVGNARLRAFHASIWAVRPTWSVILSQAVAVRFRASSAEILPRRASWIFRSSASSYSTAPWRRMSGGETCALRRCVSTISLVRDRMTRGSLRCDLMNGSKTESVWVTRRAETSLLVSHWMSQ